MDRARQSSWPRKFRGCGREDSDAHFAALYRTNFQSRRLEEALRRLGIRYRLVGGFSFYQRAEVKDVLSYVRLVMHPEDDVALAAGAEYAAARPGRQKHCDPGSSGQSGQRFVCGQRLGFALENGTAGRAVGALKSFRDLIDGLRGSARTSAAAGIAPASTGPYELYGLARGAGPAGTHHANREPGRNSRMPSRKLPRRARRWKMCWIMRRW